MVYHSLISNLIKCNYCFPDNKIGNKGVRIIAKAIKYNTALEELDLSGTWSFFNTFV